MQEIQHDHFSPEENAFRAYLYPVTEWAVRIWVRKWNLSWSQDEIQDFTSEVYVYHILPRWGQVDGRPEPSIRTFVSNGVRWELSEKIKWQNKQPRLLADAADLEWLPNARYEPDYASGINHEEAVALIDQALQTLSPYERAVWVLRQRLGWRFERIAKRLRTRDLQRRKAKALHVANHRAKQKIKVFLEEKVTQV
jgi:DNA-directed RNA polymerase specialized sigma24 family protein